MAYVHRPGSIAVYAFALRELTHFHGSTNEKFSLIKRAGEVAAVKRKVLPYITIYIVGEREMQGN